MMNKELQYSIQQQFSGKRVMTGALHKRRLLLVSEVTSEAHQRRVCVRTPRPVPELRKVTESVAVVFVRVDCGGNMIWMQ